MNENGKYSLSDLFSDIRSDMIVCGGKGLKNRLLTVLANVPFHLILSYRILRFARVNHLPAGFIVSIPCTYWMQTRPSCCISPDAVIGRGVRFPHPTGIVIGAGVEIGENVTIYQNVTLGSHGRPTGPKQYPQIGDNTTIFAGAVIFGGVSIGRDCVIGANSVVNRDVPDRSVAVGAPARVAGTR